MSENQVVVLTFGQLREFASEVVAEVLAARAEEEKRMKSADPKRYVYGLHGICDLFNVSRVTAQRYKNTFLAPAVSQNGRKIVTDADMAMALFNEYNAKNDADCA